MISNQGFSKNQKVKQPRIIFFGTPDFVIPVLEAIKQDFNLVGVVTSPDQLAGRKQILTPSPIKKYISSLPPHSSLSLKAHSSESKTQGWQSKFQLFSPNKLDPEFITNLQKLQPDLIVVAAYGKIIPQEVLDIPKYGALNIHPSMLPKYRGASPIQRTILNGDKFSGISIIKMDEKMDHGPIVFQEKFEIKDTDTFMSLAPKMFLKGAEMLIKILPEFIMGNIPLKEQDHTKATFTKLIKKEDGYFDIQNSPSPEVLDKMIRAYYTWPTAWTIYNNKIVKFLPGKLVQMEGKKPIKLEDFLRGYPNFPLKSI